MKLNTIASFLLITTGFFGVAEAQTKKPTTKSKTAVKKTTSTNKATSTPVFTLISAKDSLSYALGVDIANKIKNSGFDISTEIFHKGLSANLKGEKLLLSEEKNMDVIQNDLRRTYERKNAELKKPGEEYLAKNKVRPEVKTTSEGVQYEVLQEGSGVQPSADAEVEVHYKGTLIDGTQFDSSYDRNESITLNLNRVIEGWKIGIPLMKVGAKYKFYIPYHLAYGERDTGTIPAFSALIFEVELLGIKKNDEI